MEARSGELTLPALQPRLLESLERYRLLTTQQLREAAAPEIGREGLNRQLRLLLGAGLVFYTHRRSSHQRIWFLSPAGHEAVGSTRRPMPLRRATGALQDHDLDVNEAALCFRRAAWERGEDCEWRREVPLPLGAAPRRGGKPPPMADALLEYRSDWDLRFRFLEIDRGREMLSELLAQLLGYARLAKAGEHGFASFPPVLVIFSGRPRPYLEGRMQAMLALCTVDPELKLASQVSISFALLEELRAQGPFAPIFLRPGLAEPVNWRGEAEQSAISLLQ